ncbi:MAG: TY-Chap domain-containing protein [Nocardioidaceae bacterium]
MNNANRGGTPADPNKDAIGELDALWDELEEVLSDYLATMVDPHEGDHLIIELAAPGHEGGVGCPPYAQFAGFGDGQMIRAEVAGNTYLSPQYQLVEDGCDFLAMVGWSGNDEAEPNWYVERPVGGAGEIANQAVWVLRYYFGVAHPQLLTHQAWGPAADGVSVLGLCATGDVPTDEPHAPAVPAALRGGESVLERLALKPANREDLLNILERLLREKYEGEPTIDDDGDFEFDHLGQPVWVAVRDEQPAVEIMARVAHDVYSRRATAVEIGLLNRDSLWVKWTLRDRTVWQTLVLPGVPFVPSHMDAMLDLFFEAMTSTRDDLAYRIGAKVA